MLGSKYENLTRLKENGFNVPRFEVIRFESVVADTGETERILRDNRDKSASEISRLLKEYIRDNIRIDYEISLQCDKYAVRSSSNIEDGKKDSFAGQFDTYLNVDRRDLDSRITDCFMSLYNENVIGYVLMKNIDITELRMNVIIQEMVQSDYSGIIFTANPQGILNESVVVAGKGLGENVVSDRISTTSYFYNLTDRLYYFEGENDYLSKERLEVLIETSGRIADLLGGYLDIEFGIYNGIVYILQARNITTIDDSHPLILDNSNIVESYPGISLPLTISFVHEIYSGVFEGVSRRVLKNKKELSRHTEVFRNMVGSANGRVYYKISNWYTVLKFLPFSSKIIPVWQEMLGVRNRNYDDEKVRISFFRRMMTYINSFYEMIRVPKNMEKLNRKFIKVNREFYDVFRSELNEEEVLKLYQKLEKELLSCWDITLLNDTYAFVFTGLLKSRLKKKYEDYEEKANRYISGIANIESMKPVRELITLAYEKDNYTGQEYDRMLSAYIEKYGDRNLEELKLESLTFRTNPDLLVERIEEYREDMHRLEEIYNSLNADEKNDSIKEDAVTRLFVRRCMSGIRNREISRLNRSRIFGMVRNMFLRWGEIFSSQGLIENSRDVFYLELDEIKSLVFKKENKCEIIRKRKDDYRLYECLPAYSRLIFMDKEFDKHHSSINMNRFYSGSGELRGIPCSNGRVRGTALVISDANEARDVKDKILVTKMTDPGWVFLLASAKGVISEKGSLLSHTAIISRELKIPSIVGVDDLMNTVKTGDIIEMDGSSGIIKILKGN